MTIDEINIERIREIEVNQIGQGVYIKVSDLKEILFRMSPDAEILIQTSIMYRVLAKYDILIKGFLPHKTKLRKAGLSMDEVNKILPGSFPSTDKNE